MNTEEQIEAYFSNQLSLEEQEELMDLLEKDEALKAEFYFQLELREAIRKKERKEIKQRLQQVDSRSNKGNLKGWMAAASLAILMSLAWVFGLFSNHNDFDQLYSSHFETYPNVIAPVERSQSTESNELLNQAFEFYESNQYDKAKLAFNQLYQEEQVEYAYFYAAVSSLANEEFEAAIQQLEQKNAWKSREFEVASNWYLALAHLKMGKEKEAMTYLKKVKNSKHSLSQPAVEVIEELD